MNTAAKAMASIGEANNPAEIQRIMQQFQKENMKMDMAGEMMDDALDSAFDGDELDEETDDVMNEVSQSLPRPLKILFASSETCSVSLAANISLSLLFSLGPSLLHQHFTLGVLAVLSTKFKSCAICDILHNLS